jgi:alkaline phosphatase
MYKYYKMDKLPFEVINILLEYTGGNNVDFSNDTSTNVILNMLDKKKYYSNEYNIKDYYDIKYNHKIEYIKNKEKKNNEKLKKDYDNKNTILKDKEHFGTDISFFDSKLGNFAPID